MNKNIMELDCR